MAKICLITGQMGKQQFSKKVGPGGKRLKIKNKVYEAEIDKLQTELGKVQVWAQKTNARIAVVFEGRDTAGKGGVIKRITEHLSPRFCRIAALPAPTERETTQWYFQRYIEHLPAGGEMVLFDRSWYNRAGVEPVMGFCTEKQYRYFLTNAPTFERLLIRDGIILLKYWFSVSPDVQLERLRARLDDPLKRWKLSPMDIDSLDEWEKYSMVKDRMLMYTDTKHSPWHCIHSDIKKHARLNCIKHLISQIPYDKDTEMPVPNIPKERKIDMGGYKRIKKRVEVPDYVTENNFFSE